LKVGTQTCGLSRIKNTNPKMMTEWKLVAALMFPGQSTDGNNSSVTDLEELDDNGADDSSVSITSIVKENTRKWQ
jgi:hypothetical protein